ncbi:MAG: hypothetical protein IJ176_02375 [Prevotella sp.]|nr:hypothetical protein [Prevotella sp.]
MKRLLSLTVALLAIAVGWAQETTHFTIYPPLPGGQSTETIVEAKLVTNATLSGNLSNYEIAALVNGEVRAIVFGNQQASPASTTAADYNYFLFSIPGNFTTSEEDNGKAITFKMYNSTSGLEYDLSSPSITFDGNRHGTTSALVELSVTEVTGITLSSYRIDMNWDEEVDLSTYPRLTPTNATVPNNLKYTYGINPSYTDKLAVTEDGILTSNEAAVAPDRSWYAIITLGSYSQGIDVTVHNHAKELTVNPGYETITVNLGDSTTLRQKLAAAFSVTPANTSDYSTLTSANSSIVAIGPEATGVVVYNPVGLGETTVTKKYQWTRPGQPDSYTYTTASKTVNVKVVQGVTAINLLHSLFDCNVGDDVTEFIKQCYEVAPTDATDKSVTYELDPTSNQGVVTIENNTIKAVGKGLAEIIVRSVSNPEVYATITARVGDYATSLAADRDSHTYTYIDSDINITGDIFGIIDPTTGLWTQIGMVTAQPFGKDMYQLEVTSSDPSVVQVYPDSRSGQWYAFVKKAGTSTLTFNLSYPDFMAGTPGEPVIMAAEPVTLRIDVTQGPTAFSFNTSSITMNVGETIDLTKYVTIQPEGASVADNDYIWTVQESDGQYMSVTGNTLQALAPNIDQKGSVLRLQLQGYESLGTADINVFIYQPATSITVNTPEITVNKNDWEALKSALESAITVNPTNHTDEIVWTSDNEEYIAHAAESHSEWVPIKGGQTTMTVKVGTTTYNADGTSSFEAHATQQVTVNINVPIESIALVTGNVYVNAGDDLTDYLNTIITILPEDATNKSYHFVGNNRIVVDNGRVTLPTAGLGQVWAVADDGSGVESNKKAFAAVNQAKDVTFAKDITVKYTGSDVDISEEVKANITFDPANASRVNATVTSSNPDVATVDMTITNTATNTAVNLGVTATAKSVGETTVTMAVTYIDYLAELMDAAGDQHRTTVERSFKIIVSEGLSGFEIAVALPDPMAARTTYDLILKPQPEGAEYDPEAITIWADDPVDLSMQFFDANFVELDEDGNALYEVGANYPGVSTLNIRYDDGTTQLNIVENQTITVGEATILNNGWQWKSLWGPIARNEFEAHFMGRIDEIRSQSALMANDPQYGYYGELYNQGLEPGVAYKINCTESIESWEAAIQTGGSILEKVKPQPLQKAWTWIGIPYVLYHKLSDVITSASDGDRIVSKEDGFAEYSNGAWTGTLKSIWPTQSYLYYNNSGAETSFTWPAETDIAGSRSNSGVRFNAPRKVSPESFWQYDARPYRDNMSMVAVVNEQWSMDNEQWTIGAFVDGECRGEGLCIDGRMFITVHANQGEEISFRLRNELTGEQYDVDQTVRMQLMLGTMKAPYRLTSEAVTTGVANVQGTMDNVQERYDLGGRAVNATTTKGLTIQRGSDGKVRKVVK